MRACGAFVQPETLSDDSKAFWTVNPELTPLGEQSIKSRQSNTPEESLHKIQIVAKNNRSQEEDSKAKSDQSTKSTDLFN